MKEKNGKPDYVFLMIAPNDIREAYVKEFFYIDSNNSLQKGRNISIPWKTHFCWFLSNHFCFYQFLQQKVFKTSYGHTENIFQHFPVALNIEGCPSWDHPLFLKKTPDKIKEARALFKALLLEINQLCIKNDCKLLLVILPVEMEFDGQLRSDLYRPGNVAKYVETIATEYNILFLDLFSLLEKEKNPLKIFITKDYHYSPPGHIFVALKLYEFFTLYNKGTYNKGTN